MLLILNKTGENREITRIEVLAKLPWTRTLSSDELFLFDCFLFFDWQLNEEEACRASLHMHVMQPNPRSQDSLPEHWKY